NLDEGRDGSAYRRRRQIVRRCVRQTSRRRREASEERRRTLRNPMSDHLPEALAQAVKATLEDWKSHDKVPRLWARDASLWSNTDESKWLGWLGITEDQLANHTRFQKIAEDIRAGGFTHGLLLGMGGSSLCVEVLKLTFGAIAGNPKMFVLDSTDPAQIRAVEAQVDLAKTIFIVSSKSGSTLEPNIYK